MQEQYGDGIITLTVREIAELYPDPKRPRRVIMGRRNLSMWIQALDLDEQKDWATDLCFWWWKYTETRWMTSRF